MMMVCLDQTLIPQLDRVSSESVYYTTWFIWISFTISLWTFWSVKVAVVNGGTETAPIWLKISLFVFQRWKKFLRVWNDMSVSNDDRIFIFGWTNPLITVKKHHYSVCPFITCIAFSALPQGVL